MWVERHGMDSFIHSFTHSGVSSRGYYSEALPASIDKDKEEGLNSDRCRLKFGKVGHQKGPQLKVKIIPC